MNLKSVINLYVYHHLTSRIIIFFLLTSTADSMLAGPSIRTAHVQYPPHYSSLDIYEGSLGSDPYLPGRGSAGLSTVTQAELELDVLSVDEVIRGQIHKAFLEYYS